MADGKSTAPKRTATAAIDDINLTLHYVRVGVVSAAGLRNEDLVGKSDPYCEAVVNQLLRSTQVIQDCLDPVWNCDFHYFVQDKPATVDFKVYDEDDHGKNDLLGECKKDLTDMWESKKAEGSSWEGDIPLVYKNKGGAGSIHVKIYVRIMKPVKTEKKLESTTAELATTSNKLQETVVEVKETKNKLEGTEKVLGQTKDELNQKEQALGQTKESLAETEKTLGQTKGVLEEKEKVLGKTYEELEEKGKQLGWTQNELEAKKKEAEEKAAQLAKTEEEKRKVQQELKEKYEKMMMLQKQLESNKCEEDYLRLHMVHIDIISGNGLLNADFGGKSDPYCEAVVQGLTRSTHVVKDNLDPVWNSKFAYFLQALPKQADFHLFDEDDVGKNDSLGDAKLDLEPLFKSGEVFEGPLPVYYKGKQSGRINIKAYCKIMHPVQTEHKLVETEKNLSETTEQKAKVEQALGAKEAELEHKFKEISALTSGNSELKKKFDGLLSDLAVAEVSNKTLGERIGESEKTNQQLRERIEELKNEIAEKDKTIAEKDYKLAESDSKVKTLEGDKHKLEGDKQKLAQEAKEAKEKASKAPEPAKTEPRKTETKSEAKSEAKSEYKAEPAKDLKVDEKETKHVRKTSAARPSTLPGATAGKPSPEDWLIKVNILKGVGLRNAAIFGTIDPFCEVTVQGITSLSKTVQKTQNPDWNSKVNFFGEAGSPLPDKLKLVVRDSNTLLASAIVGEAEVDLKALWEKGTAHDAPVELSYKAKPAGKVNLQIACLFETVASSS